MTLSIKQVLQSPNGQLSSARVFAAFCLVVAAASTVFEWAGVGEWLTAAVAFSASATAQHYTRTGAKPTNNEVNTPDKV